MPNGDELLNDLHFEEEIKVYPPEFQFLARQTRGIRHDISTLKIDIYEIKVECKKRGKTMPDCPTCGVLRIEPDGRVESKPQFSKKQIAIGGGLMFGIATIVEAIARLIGR